MADKFFVISIDEELSPQFVAVNDGTYFRNRYGEPIEPIVDNG
jgi:hypothetical protein